MSLSCEVDPAFREYERTVVTAFDAYVKPVVDRYLANLECRARRRASPAPLQIMQSRGGISGSGYGAAAAGAAVPVGAGRRRDRRRAWSARPPAVADLITVDIGGTSCDIALIEDGTPALRSEGLIDGYPVRTAWSTSTRSAPAAARSPGSTPAAAARRAAFGGLRAGACLLRSWRQASRP